MYLESVALGRELKWGDDWFGSAPISTILHVVILTHILPFIGQRIFDDVIELTVMC